jgi:RNA polymerase sigma-70 factor (ECF subfamily)
VSKITNRKARPLIGDKLDELYRRFAPRIYSRCLFILADREEALDAVHDIFLKLERKLPSFRGDSEVMTWIYRIATNHCLNRLRSRKAHDRAVEKLSRVPTFNREDDAIARAEKRDLIVQLCRGISRRKAQMVFHRYYDGMTHAEIARIMGISDRAVRKALKSFIDKAGSQLAVLEQAIMEKS